MTKALTLRQRLLNTFAHKKVDRLLFSPRIYYWYLGNKLYFRPRRQKARFLIPTRVIIKDMFRLNDIQITTTPAAGWFCFGRQTV